MKQRNIKKEVESYVIGTKVGEYYGYFNENREWVVGQFEPNPLTPEQAILIENALARMNIFSWKSIKSDLNDLLVCLGLKKFP
jgi:hypothetical protein